MKLKQPKLNKKNIIIGLSVLIIFALASSYFLFFHSQKVEAAWWNDSWGYRKPIAITNSSGSDLTDFQVKALTNVDLSADITAGKVKSDLGDLRFTDINGKLLPYWIEDATTNSVDVWVKMPTVPSGGATIYMYYGNSSAGSAANGNKVFEFFDDFSSLDTSKWTWESTKVLPTIVNDSGSTALRLTPQSTGEGPILSSAGTVGDIVIYAKIRDANNAHFHLGRHSGLSSPVGDTGQGFWIYPTTIHLYRNDTGYNSWTDINSINRSVTLSSYHTYKVKIGGSSWSLYEDNAGSPNITGTEGTYSSGYPALMTYASEDMYVDYFFTCKYASTDPAAAAPATEEKGTGPIAYWAFDEGTGTTANDATANKNNGTLTNMSSTASSTSGWQTEDRCVSGKCLAFDGSNDYVVFPNYYNLNPATLSLWFNNKGDWSSYPIIISKDSGGSSGYIQYYDGKLSFWAPGNIATTNWGTPSLNTWHHLVLVVTGTQHIAYLDGVMVGSPYNSALALFTGNYNVQIGRYHTGSYYFKGLVDEPKIYSYARSAAQIKLDYNAGLAGMGGAAAEGAGVSIGGKSPQWLTNGLVGHWKMDEAVGTWNGTSGEVVDSSGNGNNGTAAGTTGGTASTTAGKFGNGGSFDGTDDYVDAGNGTSLQITSAITIGAWVNLPTFAPFPYAVSKNDGVDDSWGLIISDTGRPRLLIWDSNVLKGDDYTGGTAMSANTWHHIVGVYDGANIKSYLDGNLVKSIDYVGDIDTSSTHVLLGVRGALTQYLNGKIDDVRIYNRALSDREVRDLYNYAPGPVAYYNFDEGAGTTLNDTSGNGYNSTAFSGTPNWVQGKFGKALYFDGSTNYITLPAGMFANKPKQVTFEIWLKGKDEPFNSSIFEAGPSQKINVHAPWGDGNMYWDYGEACCNGRISKAMPANYMNNNWTHFAFTADMDANFMQIYANGVLWHSGTVSANTMVNAPTSFYLGSYDGGSYKYKGWLDDFKIYDYVRTPDQIMEDMQARGTSAKGGEGAASVSASGKTMIGYWKMDEGYGTIAHDFSPQKNDGTLVSSTMWTNAGKFNKGINVTQTSGNYYVDAGTGSSLELLKNTSDAATFTGWMKISNSGSSYNQWLIDKKGFYSNGTGFTMLIYNNVLKFTLRDDSAGQIDLVGNQSLTDNQWHYVAFVIDRSLTSYRFYVDGKLDASGTFTQLGTVTTSGKNFYIGYAPGVNQNGFIDEVKVYNYALTADEVALDYNKGSAMKLSSYSVDSSGVASSSAAAVYCVPGSTDACAPPVGEWKFEEGSGTTANDTSGNSNTGTLTNGPTWTQGKFGKALKFDGTDDYVTVGNSSILNPTAAMTISAWVNPTYIRTDQNARIVDRERTIEYSLAVNTSGALAFWGTFGGVAQVPAAATVTLDVGKWNYVVATYDGTTIRYYKNGLATGTASPSPAGAIGIGSNNTVIGAHSTGSAYQFPGVIDEVKIYNYVRTAAQIAWDYNRGAPVAWWKMDECQGSAVRDYSGNGNNGTLTIGAGGTQTAAGTCTTSGTAWGNGATGKRNASLNFDGTDDYVDITNTSFLPTGSADRSMFGWIKTNGSQTGRHNYFGYGGASTNLAFDLSSGINSDGKIYFIGYAAGDVTGNAVIGDGNWHFIGVTYDGTTVQLYVDGKADASGSRSLNTSNVATYPLVIGRQSYSDAGDYHNANGQIDDVRIYNYALTAAQVKTVYNNGAVGFR